MRKYTIWTQSDIDFLVNNYHAYKINELCEMLNRPKGSIVRKLHDEGIYKRHRPKAFNGCTEDCFNCSYSDCLKPDYEIKKSLEV